MAFVTDPTPSTQCLHHVLHFIHFTPCGALLYSGLGKKDSERSQMASSSDEYIIKGNQGEPGEGALTDPGDGAAEIRW